MSKVLVPLAGGFEEIEEAIKQSIVYVLLDVNRIIKKQIGIGIT